MKWFNSLSAAEKAAYIGGVFALIAGIVSAIIVGIFQLESKTSTDHTSPTPTASIAVSTPTIIPSSSPSLLPPLLVQQNISQVGSTSPNKVTFPKTVQAGDLIVVAITQDETTIKDKPSDNVWNTYTPVNTGPALFADRAIQHDYVELYYAKNVTRGDIQVTVNFTAPADPNTGDSNVGIYDFSGLDKTSPLGPMTLQYGVGNKPDGGLLTTTQENEVIFVVGVDRGLDNQNDRNINTPVSHGKVYRPLDQQDNSTDYERFYTEYQIVSPGTYHTDFTLKYSRFVLVADREREL